VGLGDAGHRHLQAVSSVFGVGEVVCVEPQQERREAVLTSLRSSTDATLTGVASLGEVPRGPRFDFAVSAVTADRQVEAIRGLLSLEPRCLVLERPVAHSREALERILRETRTLPVGHGVYVNCVRSLFPGFDVLRQRLSRAQKPFHVLVAGESWGVGCEAIHFIEAFRFVAGASLVECTAAVIQPAAEGPSQGTSSEEFAGSASFRTPRGDTLTLVSGDQGFGRHTLRLVIRDKASGDLMYLVDETAGRVEDAQTGQAFPIGTEPVIQSTARVLRRVLADHPPGLPTLEDTLSSHCALFDALAPRVGDHLTALPK
jgi:hypothetical protein